MGGGSLAVALGSGGVLLVRGDWTPARSVAAALGLTLALTTVVGVIQARELTRIAAKNLLRSRDSAAAGAERSAAARAAFLRASIGALTFALLAVGSAIAT